MSCCVSVIDKFGCAGGFDMIALYVGRMFNVMAPFIFSLSVCKRWHFWQGFVQEWEIVSGFNLTHVFAEIFN